MKFSGVLLSAFAAISCAVAASAQAQENSAPDAPAAEDPDTRPPIIPTSAFAERYEFAGAKLSPDGTLFAYSKEEDEVSFLHFFDADTREPFRSIELGKGFEFNWFRWAGNRRVIYSLGGRVIHGGRDRRFTRLFVYDLDDEQQRYIGFPRQDLIGDDVIYTDPAGRFVLLDVSEHSYAWPDVWRFPLDASGHESAVTVRKGRESVSNWIADDTGVVRMGYGPLRSGRTFITYRSGPDGKWKRVARLKYGTEESENWNVRGILAGSDNGFAVIENDGEHKALYEFDYSSGEPGRLIYSQPGSDIEELGFGKDGRPSAVYFTDDAPRIHWLDESMARHQEMLEKALPNGRVRILSRSDENSRMLVWNGGENDPGALYIFTPGERRLDLFANYRPALDHRLLATPKAFDYVARDGTGIRGYLTLPKGRKPENLPLIVLPHGGPFGIRDTLSYDDEVQFLANRGYAVIQPNFRGSGGYGEEFEKLGEGQIGKAMQDDLDDAMDWAVARGYVDPARVCMIGGSYGGYAALWSVIRNPERYRCAASWAGVTDWKKQLRYDRYYLGRRLYGEFRDQLEGEGDFELDEVSPARQLDRLERPVLLAHGKKDKRVPFAQYEFMVEQADKAGKSLEVLVVDEGHSFTSKETEQQWLDALEAFLAKHNPAD